MKHIFPLLDFTLLWPRKFNLLNFFSAAPWMTAPQGPPNCPPGLEYLTQIDQVLIHQQIELLEGMQLLYCMALHLVTILSTFGAH